MSDNSTGTPPDIDFGEFDVEIDFGSDDLEAIFAEADAALAEMKQPSEYDWIFAPQKPPQKAPEDKAAPTPIPPTKTRGNGITTPITLRIPLALLDWLKDESTRRRMRGYQTLLISLLEQVRRNTLAQT